MSLGHIFVFLFAFVSVVRLCISFTRSFCFGLFVSHLVPGADFLFGTKYFCFVCSVLSKTRVIAFAVRDRSALGPAFVSERIALYTVRDRSAPGAGFLFKPSIWCMRSGTV